MSNKNRGTRVETNPVDEAIDVTSEVEVVTEAEPVEEVITDLPEMPKIQNGFVKVNGKYSKLNVRKYADPNAEIVWSITNGSEVEIDLTHSTDDYYKISLTNGVEGYCVKEFITIK